MKRRIISRFLSMMLALSLLPVSASASTLDLINKYAGQDPQVKQFVENAEKNSIFKTEPKAETQTKSESTQKKQTKPAASASQPKTQSSQKSQTKPSAAASSEKETAKTEKQIKTGLPPAVNEVISDATFQKASYGNNDCIFYRYDGFSSESEMIDAIEAYIEVLEDYGYKLTNSEVYSGVFHDYWLDCEDTSLKTLEFKDVSCRLAIEGDSNYGNNCINVYYSPSIADQYYSGTVKKTEGSSTTTNYGVVEDTRLKLPCSTCRDKGKIDCSNCTGGYKEKWESVGNRWANVKEKCYRCDYNGMVDCPNC